MNFIALHDAKTDNLCLANFDRLWVVVTDPNTNYTVLGRRPGEYITVKESIEEILALIETREKRCHK